MNTKLLIVALFAISLPAAHTNTIDGNGGAEIKPRNLKVNPIQIGFDNSITTSIINHCLSNLLRLGVRTYL